MPQKPRRRLTRRTAPPRPTYPGAQTEAATAGGAAPATAPGARPSGATLESGVRAAQSARAEEYVARQMPLLRNEMRRVGWVSLVCFGLLVALGLIDRFQ